MASVHMRQRFAAPIEKTFAALTDHVAFGKWMDADIRLERAGTPAPNGLGAVRAVKTGGLTVREEVVRWEAPRAMDYRVVGSALLVNHLGELRLAPDGDGTQLDYRIRFEVPWWAGGALGARLFATVLERRMTAGLAKMAAGVARA